MNIISQRKYVRECVHVPPKYVTEKGYLTPVAPTTILAQNWFPSTRLILYVTNSL